MTNTATASAAARLRWVLGLTSTAYFMVVLDSLVVVTALPKMQSDLHADVASLQWTVNSYGIAFAAGIITAAALGDRFGRRRVFNLGLALFTLSSAACAVAPGIGALVAARTAQGLGAAVVMPLSLTILATAFPPQRRGMIVGVYGGLAGLAVAAGPIVAGVVTERLDWHWIFWLNVPIGLVALVLGARLLPESHGAPQRLDLVGVVLVSGGVVALVWALVRGNEVGWSSPQILATLLAGLALLPAFAAWERKAAAAMVPARLMRNRVFALGTVTTFLMSGATFAAAFLVTQEFQLARGYSPISTGVRLLPFFGTPMLVSPLAGALCDRIGRRPIMLAGLTLQAAGYTWVAVRGSLATGWVEIVVALLVAGIGISMALPTVPTAVLNAVAEADVGKASGANYMAQRFGAVFAVAIASAVFAAHGHLGSPAGVSAGFRPALWSCVIFAVLAALTAVAITARASGTPAETPRADVLVAA
ncbi:MFS transporter [Actinocrinis puniceicyclus]|uniref:MFS transporter n=1 Tax=Actinocrinis puniceicyclus TaxID=977794 RepID=A0A8J8BCK5_9ACTN|nr:MFS transporter [Actinocrinis puniceicyclus]MBS2964268.1 MFS transporter [Actinocrinis puniceicyclus]